MNALVSASGSPISFPNKFLKQEGTSMQFVTTACRISMVLGVVLAPVALAQSADPNQATSAADGLEEVIVTARGRKEDLQDVPLTIAVLSAEDIRSSLIRDSRDLSQIAPNLTIYSGSGRADATALVVRGLSPSTSDERYQGLSTFVDGVFVSGQVTGLEFGDLDRVEVIYGPQSVKFGRATYSGAINYVTRSPESDELVTRMRVGLSSHGSGSDNSYRFGGALEFPLAPQRAWLSIFANRGVVGSRVADAHTGGPVGEEKTSSYGATLFARVTERATIKARATYDIDDDSVGLLYVAQPTDWGTSAPGEFAYTGIVAGMAATGRWIDGAIPDPRLGLTGQDVSIVTAPDPRTRDASYQNTGGRHRERTLVSLQANVTLPGGTELTYLGSVYDQSYWIFEDFFYRSRGQDPVFAPLGRSLAANFAASNVLGVKETFKNLSHQLRLTSAADRRLRWAAGLYYFAEDNANYTGAHIGRTAVSISPTTYAATGPFAAFANQINLDGYTRGLETIENSAVFAGVDYDFTDRLTASIEARYSEEKVGYEACTSCITINVADRHERESQLDPRVIVEFAFSDAVKGYVQYAAGVKSGRFNTQLSQNYLFAPPEKLDAFELGLKSAFFGNLLRINSAVFFQNIDKQQLLGTYPNPACTPLPNSAVGCVEPSVLRTFTAASTAGDSEIYGFDLQARWRATDRLTFDLTGGYAHHEWKRQLVLQSGLSDVLLFPAGQTLVGRTTINTPRVTASASAEYNLALGSNGWNLALRGAANYTGKKFIDQANIAYIDSVTRLNARAELQSPDRDLRLAVYARDLTDERTALGAGITGTSGCNFPEPGGIQRCYIVGLPRGRELGIDLTYQF
jgi:outer membrane receptor protein involved in Fe transport